MIGSPNRAARLPRCFAFLASTTALMLARACVAWGCDVDDDDDRLAGLDISAVSVVWRRRVEPTKGVGDECSRLKDRQMVRRRGMGSE